MTLIDGIGTWSDAGSPRPTEKRQPALFLDRDGVVIVDTGFVQRPSEVRLVRGISELIAAFNAKSIPVVLVTNQSGIARRLFTWSAFEDVQTEMHEQLLLAGGARIDATFACGYHSEGIAPLAIENHPWRKPNGGMLVAAAECLSLDLRNSWMVGDRSRDLEAGKAAGIRGGTLLLSDSTPGLERKHSLALADTDFSVEITDDLIGLKRIAEEMRKRSAC